MEWVDVSKKKESKDHALSSGCYTILIARHEPYAQILISFLAKAQL
jgi:hypothetical protein